MKEQLLHFYCGGYNTLIDSAISWIEPTDEAKWNAIDALEDAGIGVSEEESVEQILQFSGVHIDFNHEPIEAKSFHGKKRIVVYPAMWARPAEKNTVFVSDSYLKYAKPYALKTIVDGL